MIDGMGKTKRKRISLKRLSLLKISQKEGSANVVTYRPRAAMRIAMVFLGWICILAFTPGILYAFSEDVKMIFVLGCCSKKAPG